VDLHCKPHLWSWVVNSDWKNYAVNTSCWKDLLQGVPGLSLRDRVRSLVILEGLIVESLLLHIERSQLRWFMHLVRIPWRRLNVKVCFGRIPPEGGLWADPGHAGDYISGLALEWLRVPWKSWIRGLGRARSGISAWIVALMTRSQISGMDGWILIVGAIFLMNCILFVIKTHLTQQCF